MFIVCPLSPYLPHTAVLHASACTLLLFFTLVFHIFCIVVCYHLPFLPRRPAAPHGISVCTVVIAVLGVAQMGDTIGTWFVWQAVQSVVIGDVTELHPKRKKNNNVEVMFGDCGGGMVFAPTTSTALTSRGCCYNPSWCRTQEDLTVDDE